MWCIFLSPGRQQYRALLARHVVHYGPENVVHDGLDLM